MQIETARINIAFGLVTMAAAWPTALCAITNALTTPLQRALQTSWCGGASQALEFLGHCPSCWSGAAAFLLAAALALGAPTARRRRVSV